MRVAILISFAAFGLTIFAARADGPLVRVDLASGVSGYIVPEAYATDHKADIVVSIPGTERVQGFWTPTEQDVVVADRVFRDLIHDAIKDPSLLFPDLVEDKDKKTPVSTDPDSDAPDSIGHEQHELMRVSDNYESYLRQYVGIIVGDQKLIFCNYSDGAKVDPSTDYIFIHRVFESDGSVHFLQCRFDPEAKTCTNVSMIGSWKMPGK